jgi:hypothetical protein
VRLQPYEIATIAATLDAAATEHGPATELAARGEAAQPVFSDYWLHNKGAAPMGYQAVTVQIKPSYVGGDGPFRVPVVVASERTVDAAAGTVVLVAPPGWDATPTEWIYRLAPGAHLAFEAVVTPAPGAAPGRYFVAARITDETGQQHEDVVTVDLRPGTDGRHRPAGEVRSGALGWAVERALATAGVDPEPGTTTNAGARHDAGGELQVTLLDDEVSVASGGRTSLRVSIRNQAASEIRGEAQILSPLETWPSITPWTQGFVVDPGGETIVAFDVAPRRRSSRDVLGHRQGHVLRAALPRSPFRRDLAPEAVPVASGLPEAPAPSSSPRGGSDVADQGGRLPWGQQTDWPSLQRVGNEPTSSAMTRCGRGTTSIRSRATGEARSSRAT